MNLIQNELSHSLINSELGQSLDAEELTMIFTHNKIITFAPGKTILKQGKKSNGIYIIIQGNAIVTAKVLGESISNKETLEPGYFIGDSSYIENIPSQASIIAKNEVKCLFINNIYLELITVYFPATKYKILNAIAKQACVRLKKLHHEITAVITVSDMITRSFFSEIIQSLTKPEPMSALDRKINFEYLKRLPIFALFNKADINILFKHVAPLKAPKNCTLINKGEENCPCYIVVHGAVQSSIIQNNKIAKLSVIGPGTLFTWPACIEPHSPFTITFSTCETAVLLMLDKPTLDFFQKEHISLWYKLFDLICLSLLALEKSVGKLDIRLQIETYNR